MAKVQARHDRTHRRWNRSHQRGGRPLGNMVFSLHRDCRIRRRGDAVPLRPRAPSACRSPCFTAAAWVLQIDGHVRVDIFYARAAPRTRALVDLFGAVFFLLPFAIVLMLVALPYAQHSWSIFESSPQPSGLPLVYLLKTLIPLFAVLVGLQGLAQAIRAALSLSGSPRRPSQ